VLPTGPEQDISVLAQMLFAAVAEARRTIRIATPYFVPDPALRMALVHASCRGVHVELVISTRSDAPLALWAGRSFYGELLEAGVEVYEYDEGVLHSKIMSVDDRWCMLGSANMDVRSFRLNFEITGVVYDQGVAARISAVISRFRKRARRVTPEALRDRGAGAELLEGAARLFAPLL
jgi:cardiolipin synthase